MNKTDCEKYEGCMNLWGSRFNENRLDLFCELCTRYTGEQDE